MQPIAQVLPGAVQKLLRDAPLSPGKVDFAWRTAVGAAMARVSFVRLEDGVLLVEASTEQWAAAIARTSSIILKRLHNTLGPEVIREIRLRR
jgi:predicted nucleic acid-binding Zn ribbon protein